MSFHWPIFVELDNPQFRLHDQVIRYIRMLFGARSETPTLDEYGIFMGRSAALRSADISRQVGAALVTEAGSIIASGYNEVPVAGGGHYFTGSKGSYDDRDFKLESDKAMEIKHQMISEIFASVRTWLKDEYAAREATDLTIESLYGNRPLLRNSRVSSILEFGRIVHAEMSALMDAARFGKRVEGSTLYCTTCPCHMCARHLIAAGVGRVVYVEPYPKSLALQLYPNSIQGEGISGSYAPRPTKPENKSKKVLFNPFVGVAPRKYIEIFEMLERKVDEAGHIIAEDHTDGSPRFEENFESYEPREEWLVRQLTTHGLQLASPSDT